MAQLLKRVLFIERLSLYSSCCLLDKSLWLFGVFRIVIWYVYHHNLYIFGPLYHIIITNKCNTRTQHFSGCCLRIWLSQARHVCEHCELLWLDSQMERNVNLEDWNAATSQTQEWDGARIKNTLIGISKLANFWTAQWMNCLPGSNQYFSHNWSSTWQAQTFYRHTFAVKKTRYVNLSKLHISSIFAIFLAFCLISATYFF